VGYAVLIYQAAVKWSKSTSVLDINYCTCTLKYSCPGNSSLFQVSPDALRLHAI